MKKSEKSVLNVNGKPGSLMWRAPSVGVNWNGGMVLHTDLLSGLLRHALLYVGHVILQWSWKHESA